MTQPHRSDNPFPGLRAFTPEEDYLFFGREEQTMDLLQTLATHRFVAVVCTTDLAALETTQPVGLG